MADTKSDNASFKFTIPLDASEIGGFKPDQNVKVLIQSGKETVSHEMSAFRELDESRQHRPESSALLRESSRLAALSRRAPASSVARA